MRPIRLSRWALGVGIAVGLLALWVGAAPVLGTGNSAIGGVWYIYPDPDPDEKYVGCTAQGCSPYCGTTTVADCSGATWNSQPMYCYGGSITIASPSSQGYSYPYAGSKSICSGGWPECFKLYNATCHP